MLRTLLSLISLISIASPAFAAKQRTVCTATINSSDEKEIFQKNLEGQGFKFVELTDFAKTTELGGSNADWFQKACDSGVKCDVLLISGHFGGSFFGENDKKLTLSSNELEEQSCRKTCDGIMKNPKEVFLFGCNTLAGKTNDSRTPEQYLQVLLRDGIERTEAERIVQARYGALGSSFKDRMRRIFSETQVIHGFDSIGPSGKTVRPFLEKFFKTSGDYNQRLQNLEGQKIVSLIEKSNSKISEINGPMAVALKGTAYTYCSGIGDDDKLRDVKKMICSLQDPNIPNSQKIATIEKMLSSPDALIYVPSLASYLKQNDSASLALAERFRNNKNIKGLFEKIYNEYESNSPTVGMEILQLRLQLDFINETQYKAELNKFVNKRMAKLDRENVDILCSLSNEGTEFPKVNWDKIPSSARTSPYLALAAQCIGTTDQRITRSSIDNFTKLSGIEKSTAIYALSEMPGYETEKIALAKKYSVSKDKFDKVAANALLLSASKNSQEQIKSIENLIDLGYGGTAFDQVSQKNIQSESISNKIIAANKNKTISEQDLLLVSAITPNNSKNWKHILKNIDAQEWGGSYYIKVATKKKERNESIIDWSLAKFESKQEPDDIYSYSDYLSSQKLTKTEQDRLFKVLKKSPGSSVYIRGILKSQKGVTYTQEEKNLLKGYSAVHKCVEESGNHGSTTCQDYEIN